MPHDLRQRWPALSPLLDELLELDEAARLERLARLRRSDAALADEAAALLALQQQPDALGFLDGTVPLPAAAGAAAAASLVGQRVGAYTLVEPLGAGGMGSVWRARRDDGRFEGDVAVKLLNLALLDHGGAERFAREGQVLARLAHPNIAHLLDAGVTGGGQPYLVLELVQGDPIDRHCEHHALGVAARIGLLLEVMAAVAHAHGRLVLHRDLKPGNILVTPEGRIKLLDFGIAKLLDAGADAAPPTALTQAAGRAFTPDFAAPEQVEGGDVTTATDVYALGVLLYLLLSGHHPTARPDAGAVERLRSVVETEPPRLSHAARRTGPEHAPALRGDLDLIAAKALKKKPAERYASVAAFADDLRRFLADEPVSARPDTWRYRGAKFVRRHRLAVAAAGFTLASLVAGIVGTTWQAIEARRERDHALFETKRANARANLMDLALQATQSPDRPVTPREILDRSVALIDKQFAHDPQLAVDLLYPIAGQYAGWGDSAKDLAVMRRAAEIAAASGDAQLQAHVACNTVDAELGAGHLEAAEVQLAKSMAALARVAEPGLLTEVECLRAQAEVARARTRPNDAVAPLQKALALIEQRGDITGGAYGTLLYLLANVHLDRGALADSWATRQRLHALNERLGRTDSHNHLSSRISEAALLLAWGEVRDAQAIVDAVAIRFDRTDPANPPPLWLERMQGALWVRLGEADRALALLQPLAERARASGALAYALRAELSLTEALIDAGRLDEAEAVLARLEGAEPSSHGGNPRPLTAALRAMLSLARGQPADATAAVDTALTALQREAAPPTAVQVTLRRLAARAARAEGRHDAARKQAREALALAERIARTPDRSADVGEALLELARAEGAAGAGAGTDAGTDATATARRAAAVLQQALGPGHPRAREALALAAPR